MGSVLTVLTLGASIAVALMIVAVVVRVRYQGGGKGTWAPPALPWFWSAIVVLAITLTGGIAWVATG